MRRTAKPSHIVKVRKNLTSEVLRAIAQAPVSARALARAAGVSNVLLTQLKRGDFQVTPIVAERIARALEEWGTQHVNAARRIRAAARQVPTLRTGRKP